MRDSTKKEERVKIGIDICLQRFHCGNECPYHGNGCMEALRKEALEVLDKQQRKLETLESKIKEQKERCRWCKKEGKWVKMD